MSVLKSIKQKQTKNQTVPICAQNEDLEVSKDARGRVNSLREENLEVRDKDTQADCWRICVHLNPEREVTNSH